MKITFIVVLLISLAIASFFLGMNVSKKGVEISFDRTQAKLSFHHLNIYSDLQSDFMSDCRSRVESRLKHAIDEQKMLMAEYVQNISDEKFEDYINLRDSSLMDELRAYEVNWDKTWTLPDCPK